MSMCVCVCVYTHTHTHTHTHIYIYIYIHTRTYISCCLDQSYDCFTAVMFEFLLNIYRNNKCSQKSNVEKNEIHKSCAICFSIYFRVFDIKAIYIS